ncbi:hypothetical protein D3C85_1819250 [compost metagenome]
MSRGVEGGDDGGLPLLWQQRRKAEFGHPRHQSALVLAVALMAGGNAPLFVQLAQGLGKGEHRMGG